MVLGLRHSASQRVTIDLNLRVWPTWGRERGQTTPRSRQAEGTTNLNGQLDRPVGERLLGDTVPSLAGLELRLLDVELKASTPSPDRRGVPNLCLYLHDVRHSRLPNQSKRIRR